MAKRNPWSLKYLPLKVVSLLKAEGNIDIIFLLAERKQKNNEDKKLTVS